MSKDSYMFCLFAVAIIRQYKESKKQYLQLQFIAFFYVHPNDGYLE